MFFQAQDLIGSLRNARPVSHTIGCEPVNLFNLHYIKVLVPGTIHSKSVPGSQLLH